MGRVTNGSKNTVIVVDGYTERQWERVGGWGPMPEEFSRAANQEGLTKLVFEGRRLLPLEERAPKV